MRYYIFAITILLGFALTKSVAQEGKWAVGPYFVVSLPQDDFANVSKDGEGIGGKLLYRFENTPFFALRADFMYVSYGEKRPGEYMSGSYFITQVRNESFQLTMGPQVSGRIGKFTPYAALLGGLYNFRTVVSIPDLYYYYGYPAAETTESQTKWGYTISGGLLFDVGLGPHLDFGLKYQKIANAVKTEVEGSKIESDATDISINLGVVFFLKD